MMRKLLTNRKAVSSMIGGIIILTLFLSALSMMVFISQQYDTYQSTVESMNQKDIGAFSENLAVGKDAYPGLEFLGNQTTIDQTTVNIISYGLFVSNYAAIGTQIARIYINSTVGLCVNLCIFNPSSEVPQPCNQTLVNTQCDFLASTALCESLRIQSRADPLHGPGRFQE